MATQAKRVHRLKITLRQVKPPVWRRIEVPSNMRLSELAAVLEAAMGWLGGHLHSFESGGVFYEIPDDDIRVDGRRVRVAEHHRYLVLNKPRVQAYERGVKLIGATAHYVTEVLDDGPIIDQGIERISHRDAPEGLLAKGRDIEKVVLPRAVRWHIENRILLYKN